MPLKIVFFISCQDGKKRIVLPVGMAIILILCCGIPVISACISRMTQAAIGQYIHLQVPDATCNHPFLLTDLAE